MATGSRPGFEQVEGVNHLNESQQNKLKAHINQLWLGRAPSTEIITIASGLVSSMQGLAMREIIVDNFAGGGGASTGIEMALGRSVDIAINHDENAVACTGRITLTRFIIVRTCLTLIL